MVMTMFCKPFLKATTHHFGHGPTAAARQWLAEPWYFMNELKPDHKSRGDPNGGPIHRGNSPFWRRDHRGWRLWFCVIVMLLAMIVYLMTGDVRWPFLDHPQAMVPIAG
jgi:hypothetical protein